jgi:hypothetical protein
MMVPEAWKTGVAVTVFVTVLGLIGWLAIARANLKVELAQARADYAMCQSANADWAAKAEISNAAVRKLREEAEARQARAVEARHKADKVAEKHADKARAILAESGKGDECRAAQRLIRQYIRGRK